MSDERRDELARENRRLQSELVQSYETRQTDLMPYQQAREKPFQTDWDAVRIDRPSSLGPRVLDDIPLSEIAKYIDWSPFFLAWELKGKYPKVLEHPEYGAAARELFEHARQLLNEIVENKWLTAKAVHGIWPANSDGDDIIVFSDESRTTELTRFHTLRQQWQRRGQNEMRALADYIAPLDSGRTDFLGAFALTAGIGCDELCARFDANHDDYNSIMAKALADRLAEALAEMLHQRVRKQWSYGVDENLTNEDLIQEKYRGIRPAPGYPAQPDHTEKRILFQLLNVEAEIGVSLTETCAMLPAASVSGLYFAHPEARYFAVDRITRDQVEDYARRKGMSVAEVERWLSPNLGYERE
jgi:5-methyltetrahydrofolate--homocysteine methyltransferase